MYLVQNYMQMSKDSCLVETFGKIQNEEAMEKFSFVS